MIAFLFFQLYETIWKAFVTTLVPRNSVQPVPSKPYWAQFQEVLRCCTELSRRTEHTTSQAAALLSAPPHHPWCSQIFLLCLRIVSAEEWTFTRYQSWLGHSSEVCNNRLMSVRWCQLMIETNRDPGIVYSEIHL